MKISRAIAIATATVLLPVLLFAQEEDEKKISRSELPAAVEKTVAEQSKGATVRGFSEEKENGQTFYEAELTLGGHSKDVTMDRNGTVVEVEEQVAIESLPANVLGGLQAKARSGKLVKVEKLTKKGKLVAYEAKVLTNGKRSEIQVGPDGKPLDHEE
jgi:ribosomal protein L21